MITKVEATQEDLLIESEIVDSDEPTSVEIPKEVRVLRTQAYDKSVSDLIRMKKDKDIIFSPEYQRNYVWDNKKASLLVESILLNIPIPIIYASEETDGKWNIVDGLQRLSALERFFNNSFKLTGLEVLQELNGQRYSELNEKATRFLNNGIIRIILIFNDSHSEIKYDIFMRLNTGAVKLKEQELRNCLYRGSFNERMKKLCNEKKFLSILGLTEPHKRMDDIELILRYFAISENFDFEKGTINDYRGRIKTFLNSYMEANAKATDDKLDYLSGKFTETIEKIYCVFGVNAFRRINQDGSFDKPINRAIMDIATISFEKYKIDDLITKKIQIVDLLKTLPINDQDFNDSISVGTSDKKKIEYRISKWLCELTKIMEN